MSKIYSVRLGLTIGILWGLSVFLLALISDDNNSLFFKMIESGYPGCNRETINGKLICGLMGFLDGFVGGLIIGLLYNNINIKY